MFYYNTGIRMRWRFMPHWLSYTLRLSVVIVMHKWPMWESMFRSGIALWNKCTLPCFKPSSGVLMSRRLSGWTKSGMLSTGVSSRWRLWAKQTLQRIRCLHKSVLTTWRLWLQCAMSCDQQEGTMFLSARTFWQSED